MAAHPDNGECEEGRQCPEGAAGQRRTRQTPAAVTALACVSLDCSSDPICAADWGQLRRADHARASRRREGPVLRQGTQRYHAFDMTVTVTVTVTVAITIH